MDNQHLFDPGPQVAVPTRPGLMDYPPELRSAGPDAKRTYRNRRLIEAGIHPVSRRHIIQGGAYTCRDCDHMFRHRANAGHIYFKCDLNATHGPGTDLRLSWPACNQLTANLNTTTGDKTCHPSRSFS